MPVKMKTKRAPIIKEQDHRKNIVKTIEKIAYRYGRHHVFNDFVYMSAAALSQPMNFQQKREDEYLRRIKTYDADTQHMLAGLLGELALAFEKEKFGDILGDIYGSMGLLNAKTGQFFTPFHISKMMGKMAGSAEGLSAEIEQKGYITVSDPCCGAGGMLIAFANNCMDCGINYQQSVLFVAQDIDPAVALICYVQMALLGMSGYVIIGNTLIPSDSYDVWFTPTYFLHGFWCRKQKCDEVEADMTAEPTIQPKVVMPAVDADVILREDKSGQFQFDF
jgi:type I restriction-modification system DNA methylase subunit